MKEQKINETAYALNHTKHRSRLRNNYHTSRGDDMSDIQLLELLLNSYYTRNETNELARNRLSEMSLQDFMQTFAPNDLPTAESEQLFLSVSAKMMTAAAKDELLSEEWEGLSLHTHQKLMERVSPYFLTDDARILYLGFDRNDRLILNFFGGFGDPELPVAMTHCHLTQLKNVVICFSVEQVPETVLKDAIRYYLKKIEYCPRSWEVYAIVLMYHNEPHWIPVKDDMAKRRGGYTL